MVWLGLDLDLAVVGPHFQTGRKALWSGTRKISALSYNQLLHHAHHFDHLLFQESNLMSVFLNEGRTISKHLFSIRPSDDRITM